MSSRVLIAGGTGSLGLAIAKRLSDSGFHVTLLTRSIKVNLAFEQMTWNGHDVDESWGRLLPGCILINLAGELVDRIPTPENIELLTSSRVQPTKALVGAPALFGKPKVWLQASTLAIFGDAGEVELDEESDVASGPPQMAGVARAWERSVAPESAERLVYMRAAVVLQRNSPALNRLVTMTKWFMGGSVSTGRQWVSWIHEKDFLNAVEFLIAHQTLSGVVHLTSPSPARNRELMSELRSQLNRPWMPSTPAWLVKLGARLLFRTDALLALAGRRAVPKKLLAAGFEFEFVTLRNALTDLLS